GRLTAPLLIFTKRFSVLVPVACPIGRQQSPCVSGLASVSAPRLRASREHPRSPGQGRRASRRCLACPGHGLALGTGVGTATLQRLSARAETPPRSGKPPPTSPPNTASCSKPASTPQVRNIVIATRRPGLCRAMGL